MLMLVHAALRHGLAYRTEYVKSTPLLVSPMHVVRAPISLGTQLRVLNFVSKVITALRT